MATKYKSQVTNKWIGSSYKGTVRHIDAKTTEMGQIVSALRNDLTPAMNNWGEKHIEKKQTEAGAKMDELYAKGWTTKDIQKSILNDEIPELSNQYVKSVVDTHSGRFEAVNTIREINANRDNYNYKETDGTIEEFWKKYLPNFEGASKEFTVGFSAAFNEWAADEKINDAKLRAQWSHDKKIMNGVKYLDTFAKQDMSTYWEKIKTLNTEMPIEGKGKAYFFDNDEMNEVAMAHVEWILDNADFSDELEIAIQILSTDRGTGKGGNKLGSLISTRDPEVGALLDKLTVKQSNFVQKERRNELYEKNKKIEAIYAKAMQGNEDGTPFSKDELNEIAEELKEFGSLSVVSTFSEFFNKDRTVNNDPNVTTAFMMGIAEGNYDTYEEMVADMTAQGIPESKLATANARWTTYTTNKDKGKIPIYVDKVVYSSDITTVEKDVLRSFTDKTTGIAKNGAVNAVINARNYMKDEILAYEERFLKDNEREPTTEERRKFMIELGNHVMKIFQDEQVVEPKGLISIEDKQEKEEAFEDLREEKQVDEKADLIKENVKALVEAGITLPEGDFSWFGADTDLFDLDSTDKKEFYEKDILPKVTEYVTQILNGVGLDASYFGKEGAFTVKEQKQLITFIGKTIFGKGFNAKQTNDITKIINTILGIES